MEFLQHILPLYLKVISLLRIYARNLVTLRNGTSHYCYTHTTIYFFMCTLYLFPEDDMIPPVEVSNNSIAIILMLRIHK